MSFLPISPKRQRGRSSLALPANAEIAPFSHSHVPASDVSTQCPLREKAEKAEGGTLGVLGFERWTGVIHWPAPPCCPLSACCRADRRWLPVQPRCVDAGRCRDQRASV